MAKSSGKNNSKGRNTPKDKNTSVLNDARVPRIKKSFVPREKGAGETGGNEKDNK